MKSEAGGSGRVTRGNDELEIIQLAWDKWEKEEYIGRMARKKRKDERILSKIPLNNNRPSTTPAICS
jgi:hypothetical protein